MKNIILLHKKGDPGLIGSPKKTKNETQMKR